MQYLWDGLLMATVRKAGAGGLDSAVEGSALGDGGPPWYAA